MYHDKLIEEVSKYVGFQEKGDNRGPEVEMFQRFVDGKASGEPWCCCMMQYGVGQVERREKIRTRLFKTEHVMTMWNKTPVELRVAQPRPGCIAVWNYVGTSNGHCGLITKVYPDRIETIEGNTSDSKKVEREGDGVFKKERLLNPKGKMKIVGFIDPFANLMKG